jgi:hypothetical protein
MTDLGKFRGKNHPTAISARPPSMAETAAFFVALCVLGGWPFAWAVKF